MWYWRFFKRIRRWENDLCERNNWPQFFGAPSYFIFGWALPLLVLLFLSKPIMYLTGMGFDAFGYVLFGIPTVIFLLFLYYVD